MTTTRARRTARTRPAWDDVSVLADRAGARWWVAVLVALLLSTAGVFADLQRIDRLGLVFQVCYFLGCLLAILIVQRRGLFGPMVQPPLILAVTVPTVVLLAAGAPSGAGLTAKALAIGTPLINGFPTMAITTGITVAIGIFRIVVQRPPDDEPPKPGRRPAERADPRPRRSGTERPEPRRRREEPPEPPRRRRSRA